MSDQKRRYKLDVIIAKQVRLTERQKKARPVFGITKSPDQVYSLLDRILRKIGRSHAS